MCFKLYMLHGVNRRHHATMLPVSTCISSLITSNKRQLSRRQAEAKQAGWTEGRSPAIRRALDLDLHDLGFKELSEIAFLQKSEKAEKSATAKAGTQKQRGTRGHQTWARTGHGTFSSFVPLLR